MGDETIVKKRRLMLVSSVIIGILLLGLVFFNLPGKISGNALLDVYIKQFYPQDSVIGGNLKLSLQKGELIPLDSKLVINEAGDIREILLRDLVSGNSNGSFYISGKSVSGNGEGYGFPGEKIIYPKVYFTLEVFDNNSEALQAVNGSENSEVVKNTSEEIQVSNETEVPVVETQETPVVSETSENQPVSVVQEPVQESAQESQESLSSTGDSSGSLLTGNVIADDDSVQEISGSVVSGGIFSYNVDGKMVKIKHGSVYSDYENLSDGSVVLTNSNGQVMVTTAYSYAQKGFGKEYSGSGENSLEINFDKLNISAFNGTLVVSLVYDGEVLDSVTKEVSSSGKILSETENALSITQQMSVVDVVENSSLFLDLSNYFSGAESYSFDEAENVSLSLEGSKLQIVPEKNFVGKIKTKVYAIINNSKLSQDLVIDVVPVVVLESNLSVQTKKATIIINRPVKWQKKIVGNVSDVSVELPKEAENVSIKTGNEAKVAEQNINVQEIKIEEDKKAILTGEVTLDISPKKGIFTRLFESIKKAFTGNVVVDVSSDGTTSTHIDNGVVVESGDKTVVNVSVDQQSEVVVEYQTPGPVAEETLIDGGKKVVISDVNEMGYTDILAYSELDNTILMTNKDSIKLYHDVNGTREVVQFDAYDLDENGKIDYIEWVVPHLSQQTYEIIYITKAQLLDSSRNPLSEVYDKVKSQDGNYLVVPTGDYVRVTFEKNLISGNDLTIYAKGSGKIEVYNENSNDKIGEIVVDGEKEYKTYPAYIGAATYDLLFLGNIELDYVVDPSGGVCISTDMCSGHGELDCNSNSPVCTTNYNQVYTGCSGSFSCSVYDGDYNSCSSSQYCSASTSSPCSGNSGCENYLTSDDCNTDGQGYGGCSWSFLCNVDGGNCPALGQSDCSSYSLFGCSPAYSPVFSSCSNSDDCTSYTNSISCNVMGGYGCSWDYCNGVTCGNGGSCNPSDGSCSCLGNWNPSDNCNSCSFGWIDNGDNCGTLAVAPSISINSPSSGINTNPVLFNYSSDAEGNGSLISNLDGSLVSWYRADNSDDAMGVNNGVWQGTESYSSGKFGSAFSFDGSNYVSLGNTSSLQFRGAFSVGAWINPSDFSDIRGIISESDDVSDRGYYMYLYNNLIYCGISSDGTGSNFYYVAVNYPYSIDEWSSVFCNWNGTQNNGMGIYINGVLRPNAYNSGLMGGSQIYNSSQPVVIGAKSDGGWKFSGKIDDVLLFNRSLTPEEIMGIYNATSVSYSSSLELGGHNLQVFAEDANGISYSSVDFNVGFGYDCSSLNNCNYHGSCVADGVCSCENNYFTNDCSVFCDASTTCNSQGSCNSDGSCSCNGNWDSSTNCGSCLSGFYGADCSVACDASTTCNNNGVCDSNGACVCNEGYFGPSCSCGSGSCNAGVCNSDGSCNCDGTGYGGSDCSVDNCQDVICSNGGSCDRLASPLCSCLGNWNPFDNCNSCLGQWNVSDNCNSCNFGYGGYDGLDCDTYCANGGYYDIPSNSCICSLGYYGSNCNLVDDIAPVVSIESENNQSYVSSLNVSVYVTEENPASIIYYLYNSSGELLNETTLSMLDVNTNNSIVFSGYDSGIYYVNVSVVDLAQNIGNSETLELNYYPPCFNQCSYGGNCNITTNCSLNNDLCLVESGHDVCQFRNLTVNASIRTLNDAQGNGKNLTLYLLGDITFLPGSSVVFSGADGVQGGNGGIVNVTVPNLFNTTFAQFIGVGGSSTGEGINGGNGGELQINYKGLIRYFNDDQFINPDTWDYYPSNTPLLNGGGSFSGSAGIDTTSIILNRNEDCNATLKQYRDPDTNNDGKIDTGDVGDIVGVYGAKLNDADYNQTYDLSCHNKINVVDISKVGFSYQTR